MVSSISISIGICILLIALIAEYFDSTLGMGYGTTLTPLLLILGFSPIQIVPAILVSELCTGIIAGCVHYGAGNVEFFPKKPTMRKLFTSIRQKGFWDTLRCGTPKHLKISLLIATCSIVGTVTAVFIAVKIPEFYLKLYIGILVLLIGIGLLATMRRVFTFSWPKVTVLGIIAAFNKGLSGGGYGPVVTGGQLLSGISEKNAIAITSLAEGLTCAVGLAMYLILQKGIDTVLIPYLLVGAILSVPLSVVSVKAFRIKKLKILIAGATIVLGAVSLWKLFF